MNSHQQSRPLADAERADEQDDEVVGYLPRTFNTGYRGGTGGVEHGRVWGSMLSRDIGLPYK
jgi:hypothetical protein